MEGEIVVELLLVVKLSVVLLLELKGFFFCAIYFLDQLIDLLVQALHFWGKL